MLLGSSRWRLLTQTTKRDTMPLTMQVMHMADECRVEVNGWHLVGYKRAKLLRKRGEFVKWSSYYLSWIWDFSNRTTLSRPKG
jgi:hypothetical protein